MGRALLVLLCDGEVPVSLEEREDVWGRQEGRSDCHNLWVAVELEANIGN